MLTADKDTLWTYAHTALLWELSKENILPREIALKLAKPEATILAKAKELGIPLASSSKINT